MLPYVNIHTHNIIDDKEIISILNIDVDNIANVDVSHFYSVGIHPWSIGNEPSVVSSQLLAIGRWLLAIGDASNASVQKPKVFSDSQVLKALGECGLDRACDSDFGLQKEIFIRQIELSEQYHKPMIIHAVRSYPDIISVRKETKPNQPWIIHGFNGNEHSAEQLLRHEGICLSLGEVLFKNEERARRLLNIIPSDRLFLETDVDGRSIVEVYEKASLFSGVTMEILRKDIFDNFVKIFGKI